MAVSFSRFWLIGVFLTLKSKAAALWMYGKQGKVKANQLQETVEGVADTMRRID